ncbi:MAG TPA: amidohydrolase family protein [Alphaproteobacteria bacterium]|nr:amidohydrolase family protein [Alphaproteobacteria bacterium]
MSFDCIVKNGTVVFPDLGVLRADIGIAEGRIAAILEPGRHAAPARETIDAAGHHVFPGLIDAHLHWGIAERITEYTTETVYATQGGFTSVLGHFLNSAPYSETFVKERAAAEARAFIDFGFHFGMGTEAHMAELGLYIEELGVTSFKYFTNFKGDEGLYLGLTGTDDGFMYELMQKIARYPQAMLAIHPENIELVRRYRLKFQSEGRDTLKDWSLAKPPITESIDTLRAMYYAEQAGCPVYFVHTSSKLALDEIRHYRRRYPRVHVETCPQYLTHTMESDAGTIGKANPPFRAQEDVDALWEALADGTIEVVGADHVARKRATKEKNIWQASQGFPGTATILPVLLSEGYHKGRLTLPQIARLLGTNPARIFGLDKRKGDIFVGADADLTIVDIDKTRVVRADELGSYADYSLYEGWSLKGWPVTTIVRGTVVMRDGKIVGPAGHGQFLKRPLSAN